MGFQTVRFSVPLEDRNVVGSQVPLVDSETKRTIIPFCGNTSFKIGRLLLEAGVHPIFSSMGMGDHQRYILLLQKEKSGVAEHCVTLGHVPMFDQTAVSFMQ